MRPVTADVVWSPEQESLCAEASCAEDVVRYGLGEDVEGQVIAYYFLSGRMNELLLLLLLLLLLSLLEGVLGRALFVHCVES